jgi:hypothetical protein
MHDIDQVQLEEPGPPFALREQEYEEFEDEEEVLEFEDESSAYETVLDENTETELAAEFLEVSSEQELEHFLGNLLKTVTGAAKDFARSREGRQIGGILKKAAGRVLPVVGRAAGQAAGAGFARVTGGNRARYRKAGGQLGAAAGRAAKRYFGLELEGISLEDQEFEMARQFVRFGAKAIGNTLDRTGTGPAPQVARQAAVSAAEQFAPGLLTDEILESARTTRSAPAAANRTGAHARGNSGCVCGGKAGARSGRWETRGNTIVLFRS